MNRAMTRRHLTTTLLALLAAWPLLTAAPAEAQTPQLSGSYTDWNVYELQDVNDKICYMASVRKKQEGDYTRRGSPAVLVTRRPGVEIIDEVSVQPGYGYKEGSEVELKVDARGFTLFTQGEHAWTKNEKDDQALISAMQRGSNMTVRGTSSKDTSSLDTYSLLGFTKAYQAMGDACAR